MCNDSDNSQFVTLGDLPAALGLLSRLPVRVNTDSATKRGARAAWAYPFAGLALALIAAAIGQFMLWLGLPIALTAGVVLATLVIITGAMHEDGIADTADGFWGGWDKINRLKIMKDSHTGVYGATALVLSLGLRWQALALLIAHGALWPALIVTAMLSRAAMVAVMAHLPFARDEGLSRSVGRPPAKTAALAALTAALATLFLFQLAALWLIAATAVTTILCAQIAKTKIGGQTGDTLGATQQITEIALLLTLTALLS